MKRGVNGHKEEERKRWGVYGVAERQKSNAVGEMVNVNDM